MDAEVKSVTKLIDALTARTRFGELMDEVDTHQVRVVVSRRGKAKVVILSVRDYLQNIVKQPELLTKIQLSATTAGLDKLSDEDIDAEITAYRKAKKKNAIFP